MKKILILEDEMSIREYLVINFKRAGFEVVAAATGGEAISAYNDNPDIQVAVLDVMLPDINGFEVCRKIREKSKAVGIIMLSAKGEIFVCKNGAGIDFSEEVAKEILLEDEITIKVNLNDGEASATAYGCDLTYEYVKINGDYRT